MLPLPGAIVRTTMLGLSLVGKIGASVIKMQVADDLLDDMGSMLNISLYKRWRMAFLMIWVLCFNSGWIS